MNLQPPTCPLAPCRKFQALTHQTVILNPPFRVKDPCHWSQEGRRGSASARFSASRRDRQNEIQGSFVLKDGTQDDRARGWREKSMIVPARAESEVARQAQFAPPAALQIPIPVCSLQGNEKTPLRKLSRSQILQHYLLTDSSASLLRNHHT